MTFECHIKFELKENCETNNTQIIRKHFKMVKIYLNKFCESEISFQNIDEIFKYISATTNLVPHDFYLEQNGKRIHEYVDQKFPVYVRLCILGGKGGFGSMLRAIGAQIEKTTNREACRDLSGRRLRDINEEKRLKAWLEKQGEREREAEEKKRRKIEKLLAVPKHDFKDEEYEEARSKLTEKVCDAVEEGFKKHSICEASLKRKCESNTSKNVDKPKKKKTALWIDDNLSSNDDTDSDRSSDESDKATNDSNSRSSKCYSEEDFNYNGRSDAPTCKKLNIHT